LTPPKLETAATAPCFENDNDDQLYLFQAPPIFDTEEPDTRTPLAFEQKEPAFVGTSTQGKMISNDLMTLIDSNHSKLTPCSFDQMP
jgi:hypothetical protein